MNISLVRLSKIALAAIAFLSLVLLAGTLILFTHIEGKQRELTEVLDLQRRVSAFSVAGDAMILNGVDLEALATLRRDAEEIKTDLRYLAESYPGAGNGVTAIDRMLNMLEVADNTREKAQAEEVTAAASLSPTFVRDSLMGTMAAHGVALEAAVGVVLEGRQKTIVTEATWLFGSLAGFAVLFASVSFMAFSLLHYRVGLPLQALANTIRAIESGKNGARVPEHRNDELGKVGKAFNSLLVRLKLFEKATEHLNDIVIITEAQEIEGPEHPRIVFVNRAFERITGYDRNEVIGKTPRILQGPDTDRKALGEIKKALASRTSVRVELINYTKAGEPLWLDLDIVPITDGDGSHSHFVAVERDITNRKHTEQKLRTNEERLRLVSRVTTDFIWDWDVAKDEWKRSAEHLATLGLPGDTSSTTFDETMDIVHPDDRDRVRESLRRAVDGSADSWEEEYCVTPLKGKSRQVVSRAAIVRDDEGRATRLVGGVTDVTEIRTLDQQLHEAQKLESIGQLTGGLAHDFNNLLTIILGNTDMILDRSSDEIIRALCETTLDAAERGAQLIDNLLAFASRQPLSPEATDVNDLVNVSKTLLRKSVQEGVDLKFNLAAKSAVTVVDPNRLQSAILNLVINSGHAVGERGTITVETDNALLDHDDVALGNYVRISVRDNGTGMSPDVLEQAFEPFFTTRPLGEGTGLGLSTVYGFAKQSGGHAHIFSELGEGTTVRIYLPVTGEGDPLRPNERESIKLQGNNEEILVVEDDEYLRENVTSQLNGLGYRVREAADADEALKILRAESGIDLLFTDVVMPGSMNGPNLATEALRLYPDLQILFTSGYANDAMVGKEKLEDRFHLLRKPYRLGGLARAVWEALN